VCLVDRYCSFDELVESIFSKVSQTSLEVSRPLILVRMGSEREHIKVLKMS
jgi:hypothetical protein